MTTLIVDASVAVKWFVKEHLSTTAIAIARSRITLTAPRLLFTEVANAMVRKAIRGEIAVDQALQNCGKLPMFFDEIVAIDDVIPVPMRNAIRFCHPVYDLIYLELAYRREAQLITADQRLADKISGTEFADNLVLLSDWRPA